MSAAHRYRSLLERLDAWFAGARERHPGVVPCAARCSACCHGPFDVSTADLVLLREGVRKLAPGVAAAVLERARAQVTRARALEPGLDPAGAVASIGEDRFDAICDALAAEPCPLLDAEGRCLVYEDRPLVCRLIGLPMRSPLGRLLENQCPIRDHFPAYAALPAQDFDLEAFEAEEHESSRAAATELFGDPEAAGFETWIAAAIVRFAEEGAP